MAIQGVSVAAAVACMAAVAEAFSSGAALPLARSSRSVNHLPTPLPLAVQRDPCTRSFVIVWLVG